MPFRPASSECTGPLWITIRLLWRRQTSAARQTLSLQRYLRYVIMLRTAGLQQASVWCCTAPRDKWWQGCFRQSSQCNELSDCSSCFNCSVGQLLWFLKFFLSYSKYFLWCWLPGRISWSEAQRIAKTSRLNIHWKVSSDSDEHSASTLINIARSSWVVMRPVELTLPPPPPPPQLSSTSLWTEWRAVLLFCM